MEILLSVRDSDQAYCRHLMEWLLVHPETGFTPAGTTTGQAHGGAMGPLLVLRSAREETDGWQLPANAHCIVLEEGTSESLQAASTASPWPRVKKYQPVEELLASIRQVACEKEWIGARTGRGTGCRATVVVHLSGGGHLQPVAPILAGLCARQGATLLLSLDPTTDIGCWYEGAAGGGLSRLAFEVLREDGFTAECLATCVSMDTATGARVIRMADMPQDAVSFSCGDVRRTLEAAGGMGTRIAIIDGGAGLTERNLQLLGEARQVVLVTTPDAHGVRRMQAALEMGKRLEASGTPLFSTGQHVVWAGAGRDRAMSLTVPDGHQLLSLPAAYPDGFPANAWDISDSFLRAIHSLVPGSAGVMP